jgi:hypothetical protein
MILLCVLLCALPQVIGRELDLVIFPTEAEEEPTEVSKCDVSSEEGRGPLHLQSVVPS